MANDKQKVLASIERAAQLMNSDYFNQLVESKAPHGNKNAVRKTNGGTSLTSDLASFEAQAGLATTPQVRVLTEGRELPDFNTIKESMRKQPTPPMDTMSAMMTPPSSFMPQQQQPQVIREVVQQTAPQPQYIPQGIDYNYIKYIVNECIKESLAGQLNESTNLMGIKMAGGNKIQFEDRKGNIYEGVLTLKKKVE